MRGKNLAIGFGQRRGDLGAAIGNNARNQALDQGLVFGSAQRHGPLEGIVEDQNAHLIDWPQILHHADGGQPGQLDFLAFHGRRFVDDQHYGGAFGRARRREFRGQRAIESILHFLLVVIGISLTGDHEQSPALLDEVFNLVFSRSRQRLQILIVEDHQLIIGEDAMRHIAGSINIEPGGGQGIHQVFLGAWRILRHEQNFGTAQSHGAVKPDLAQVVSANHTGKVERAGGGQAGMHANLIAALFQS